MAVDRANKKHFEIVKKESYSDQAFIKYINVFHMCIKEIKDIVFKKILVFFSFKNIGAMFHCKTFLDFFTLLNYQVN